MAVRNWTAKSAMGSFDGRRSSLIERPYSLAISISSSGRVNPVAFFEGGYGGPCDRQGVGNLLLSEGASISSVLESASKNFGINGFENVLLHQISSEAILMFAGNESHSRT